MKKYPPFVAQKKVTNQKAEMLVAGIVSPSDPSIGINSTKTHSKVDMQIVSTGDGLSRNGSIDQTSKVATATITIASNDFHTGMTYNNFAEIYIGEYRLKANTHFDVGATAGAETTGNIAINLATAIDQLKGFSATPNVNDVEITCTDGVGSLIHFTKSERQTNTVFTLSPSNGKMGGGLAFGSISKS